VVEKLIRRLRRFFAKRGQELSESPPQARVLKKFLDSTGALVHQEPLPGPTFPEGSPAARDAVATDIEAVKTLLTYCEPLQESAAHHGWSITRALVEPTLTFSLFTDCRAVLECCSTGVWLLDPKVDSMERIRRSLLLRFQNVSEQEKLARTSGNNAAAHKAREQMCKIVERAKGLGLPTTDGSNPRIIGPSPGRTELAKDVFDAEPVYRILSGAAHGQATYLRELGMSVDPERRFATVELSATALELVTTLPIVWCSRLTYELRGYRGLPTADYENLCERTFKAIHAGADSRFWREQ
jgi:hypothetical protein